MRPCERGEGLPEGVIRRCVSNRMTDYAALIRPCNSEIDYRWCVPKGMACRGCNLRQAAGDWIVWTPPITRAIAASTD
jgi:hypothetical protein